MQIGEIVMVVLAETRRFNINKQMLFNNGSDTRKETRLPLKMQLFLRRPFNSSLYAKAVETIDMSASGLLVACDVNLEIGAELEVTNINRDVVVKAVVRHTAKDPFTERYFLGLSICSKETSWFVQELATKRPNLFSLATEAIC